MSKPVNLNTARKARALADAHKKADENSVAFGRSKSEKDLIKAKKQKAETSLDGHRREK